MLDSALFKLSVVALSLVALCGCDSGYGKKVVFDGTEVYYDGQDVTKAEADQLGKALKQLEFTDGKEKAVQLQKSSDGLVFKMVVAPEFIESGELDKTFEFMCLELSAAFDGKKFECHACNDKLVSQKKFNGLYGKRIEYGKGEMYFNSLNDEQLEATKEVLDKLGFLEFDGTLFFGKGSGNHEFRMICKPEFIEDEEFQRETSIWRDELSKAIGDQKVAVMLCDEYLEPKFTRDAE